jgi:hypothetical protein
MAFIRSWPWPVDLRFITGKFTGTDFLAENATVDLCSDLFGNLTVQQGPPAVRTLESNLFGNGKYRDRTNMEIPQDAKAAMDPVATIGAFQILQDPACNQFALGAIDAHGRSSVSLVLV